MRWLKSKQDLPLAIMLEVVMTLWKKGRISTILICVFPWASLRALKVSGMLTSKNWLSRVLIV